MTTYQKIRRGMLAAELRVTMLVADAGPRGYWHGRIMQLSSENAWTRLRKRGLLVEVPGTSNMQLARTPSATRRAIKREYADVAQGQAQVQS